MARYLTRIAHDGKLKPHDAKAIAQRIRLMLASREAIGNLRIRREGIELFNEERFWESHEMLERIWHPAKGEEREIIQGMILTAAALVHAQKDRNETSLGMLRKAENKLGSAENYEGIDVKQVRQRIDEMLQRGDPKPFKIKL